MLAEAHMACELCKLASVCVHCWWADVYADEKSFGNVASSALDEMRLALAQGSCGPHDAADKSVSALNAPAVWMRECKMNGCPPRSWFSPWTSHHSSWLILCAALIRKSQVVLNDTGYVRSRPRIHHPHQFNGPLRAHTPPEVAHQMPLKVRHCISKTALYWPIQKCWMAGKCSCQRLAIGFHFILMVPLTHSVDYK